MLGYSDIPHQKRSLYLVWCVLAFRRQSGSFAQEEDSNTSLVSEAESAAAKEEAMLKHKLKAAAYSAGGVNWRKLFHKVQGGQLNFQEFRSRPPQTS